MPSIPHFSLKQWAVVFVGTLLFGMASAQTCNSNIVSSFTSWSGNGSTLTDNTTGLIWQRCASGQSWTGSSCAGTATTSAWAAAVSGAPAGWRLPNVKELESMVERRCASPAVDAGAFPGMPSVSFWSSTPGWAVSFSDGSVGSGQNVATAMAVRYVQGGNAASDFDAGPGVSTSCVGNVPLDRVVSQLVVNVDDTVTDQTTRLTWRRCAEGMTFGAGRCTTGTLASLNWQQATELSLVPANAVDGWRVPNVKELESLVDRSCANPAVNGGRFPDQPAVDFWSSTPGWAVSLNDGSVLSGQTLANAKAVRMVKGGAGATAYTPGSAGSGACTTQAPADFKRREWVENTDQTLYDARTGLTWDRCVLGQSWSTAANGCVGTPETLSWSAAHFRANGAIFLSSNGWRVPNVKELESIVDRRCALPALNPEFFRGNKETLTWSSTPGWAVNMADGSVVSGQSATFGMSVRLVRGGKDASAFDAAKGQVPGAVLGGPPLGVTEVAANIALLAPTAANQRLIFVTHGWNADSSTWASEMTRILCIRLGATVNSGLLATSGQSGVSHYCQTPQWRVVAYNWKGLAFDGLDKLPWHALSNARDIGERLGKAINSAGTRYEFVHLMGHSAGSNLIHEFGRQLKLADANTPKIQATFLDAFCGYSDRCDYGFWSDWAESYYDNHEVFPGEGTQTRMNLCNASNFDLSRTYPLAEEPGYLAILADGVFSGPIGVSAATVRAWGSVLQARHAWPYRYYVGSAAVGVTPAQDFNMTCLKQQAGSPGFGLSYFSYPGTPSAFINARKASTAYPNGPYGSLFTQGDDGGFGGQSAVCGAGNSGPILSTLSAVGSAVSTKGHL